MRASREGDGLSIVGEVFALPFDIARGMMISIAPTNATSYRLTVIWLGVSCCDSKAAKHRHLGI
jgi:hypothetical protein